MFRIYGFTSPKSFKLPPWKSLFNYNFLTCQTFHDILQLKTLNHALSKIKYTVLGFKVQKLRTILILELVIDARIQILDTRLRKFEHARLDSMLV